MSLLYGMDFQHQGSGSAIPHILGFLTTRSVADDGLFEVRAGAAVGTRVFRLTQEGQVQAADGTLAKPSYAFASDKTSGLHYVASNNIALVVNGVNIIDISATGISITGTFAVSGGTSLDGVVGGVTPAAGTFTTLNATGGGALTGTWSDLGTVSAATSITSTVFIGPLTGDVTGNVSGSAGSVTGNAGTATLAATVTVVDSTDATSFIAMFDSATGSLAAKTDLGLTYASTTGILTATGFAGPLVGNVTGDLLGDVTGNCTGSAGSVSGNAATATLAATITVVDSTDATSSIAMFDSATGSLAIKTDAGLTYAATTGILTATGFAGPLVGDVTGDVTGNCTGSAGSVSGNAATATLAATITVVDSTDATSSIAMFDSATGSLAIKTDAGLTYSATTGILTATGFAGPLVGDVTGNVSGSAGTLTGNASTATALETARTINTVSFDGTANIVVTAAAGTLTGATLNATVTASSLTSFGTLTSLQVDNLNVNGNTLSATTGAVNITPVAGSAIVLDGTINVDAGVVTGATSITSTTFVGALTGNADTATSSSTTLATTVTVVDSTDATSFIAMFDDATGSLAIKTDGGLTYAATTGILTATGFAGPLVGNVTGDVSGSAGTVTGNAGTATLAATVTVVDSTDATSFIAMFDSATGSLAVKTDGGLTYAATTGILTATGFAGPLVGDVTGNVSGSAGSLTGNASTATLAATVTVVDSTDATSFIAMFDSATGSLAVKTDGGLTYAATTGILTATGFAGPLVGDVTGDVTGNCTGTAGSATGNAATATALATARTINTVSFDGTANIVVTAAAGTLTGATLNATVTASSLTSFGTLASLQIDNLNLDGNTLSATTGALNLTPTAGSAVVLDGTISVDAGVVTGATSITSTTFVGALTGNADTASNATTATALATPRNINGVAFDGSANVTVTAAAGTLTGVTLNATVTASSLTSFGTLTSLQIDNININGNTLSSTTGALNLTPTVGSAIVLDGTINVDAGVVTGATSITSTTFVGALTGNASTATLAATATALDTARTINTVSFDGTANITVTAAAGTLTGTTLKSTVVTSSLTSLGTITSLVATTADINGGTFDGIVGGTTPAAGSFTTGTFSGILSVDDTTNSTNSTTGSIHTDGGLGVVKDVQIAGNLRAGGVTSMSFGDGSSSGAFLVVNTTITTAPATPFAHMIVSGDTAIGQSQPGYGLWVKPVLTEDPIGGTHADMVMMFVEAKAIVTDVGATITNATTVKIENAPTEGGTNRSLWVKAGMTEIGGDLEHTGTNLGFYSTTGIAQQTGVAVTAGGIHAACVALGLFTA